jgi:uncharacterized protein (TIGR00730 family)
MKPVNVFHGVPHRHVHDKDIEAHITEISKEFRDGFNFLKKYPRSVTIYGSARTQPDTLEWRKAEELGRKLVTHLHYAVVTGGGPGIMAAAHKGARDVGGNAVALGISLPHELNTNSFATDRLQFTYFFARKTMLDFATEACVFFPGGFGTFDELFSTLTLVQTRKIPSVPIILFGCEYWNELLIFIKKEMFKHHGAIADNDMNIFKVTDDIDEIIEIVRTSPVADWWRNIN